MMRCLRRRPSRNSDAPSTIPDYKSLVQYESEPFAAWRLFAVAGAVFLAVTGWRPCVFATFCAGELKQADEVGDLIGGEVAEDVDRGLGDKRVHSCEQF